MARPSAWDARLDKDNAFDLVRIVFATLVVFEHSFFLIDNSARREPLEILTHGQMHSGALAVYMFFSVSGFLVTRSLMQARHVTAYLARRVGRILPGFLVAMAIGYLVVGPLCSSDVRAYFAAQNWKVLGVGALFLKGGGSTATFAGNPLSLVHGTLWSIQYEFDCYLILAILGVVGLMRAATAPFTALALFVAFAAGWLIQPHLPVVDHGVLSLLISSPSRWPELFPFFFFGSAFYLWRDHIPKSAALMAAGLAAMGLTAVFGGFYWAVLIGGSYAVFFIALSWRGEIVIAGRKADLSYGVYLYGWPVQQVLLYLTQRGLSPLGLFLLAMVITLPVAWLSWTLIEKPALKAARSHEHWFANRPLPAS